MTLKTDALKPALKTKWLAALRSGQFKQGQGALKSVDLNYDDDGNETKETTFCCLGVLREIAKADGVRARDEYYLSPKSCGITNATQAKLAEMNDGERNRPYGFKAIATYIEKHL